jgi:hypothetical protein
MGNMIDHCVERERLLLSGKLLDYDVTKGWSKFSKDEEKVEVNRCLACKQTIKTLEFGKSNLDVYLKCILNEYDQESSARSAKVQELVI